MPNPEYLDDARNLTPEQRLTELAAILAAGWQRLSSPEKQLDSARPSTPWCDNGLTATDAAMPGEEDAE